MVRISLNNVAFVGIFELKASPVEGQSRQRKDKKRREKEGKKKILNTGKPKDEILNSAHGLAKMS